jgi:hypothetical protein
MIDHAQLILPHDSTGISPFKLNYGYEPRISFDWKLKKDPFSANEKVNRQDARKYAILLHNTWAVTKAQIQKVQIKQQRLTDLYRKEIDFGVGDYVYVSTKNWSTDRPNRKLASQMKRLFLILTKESNSYKVQLLWWGELVPTSSRSLTRPWW